MWDAAVLGIGAQPCSLWRVDSAGWSCGTATVANAARVLEQRETLRLQFYEAVGYMAEQRGLQRPIHPFNAVG